MRSITLFLGYLLLAQVLLAQQTNTLSSDSLTQINEAIELSEISIQSGEAITHTKNIVESLISDDELGKLEANNIWVNGNIDSIFTIENKTNLSSQKTRTLDNKLAFWKNLQQTLDSETSLLKNTIVQLEETKLDLNKNLTIWESTQAIYENKDLSSTISDRISEVIQGMEDAKQLLSKKSNAVLALLDNSTETSIKLKDIIKNIDQAILNRESQVFSADQPSLFSIQYVTPEIWEIAPAIRMFYRLELNELFKYLLENIPRIIFQLIFLIGLIAGFTTLRTRINSYEINSTSVYKKLLKRILARPWSAAFILGLFASAVIFPNRPLILKDITIILATLPIVLIVKSLMRKQYYRYVNVFGLLIFMELAYIIFPPEHMFYKLSIMVIALLEILILIMLTREIKKSPITNKYFKNLIILLLAFNLGSSFLGLIGIISGMSLLAETAVSIPISNAFSLLLLIISATIINGLTELAVDSPQVQKTNVFRIYGTLVKSKTTRFINFISITFWLYLMLMRLNLARPLVESLTEFFVGERSIGSATFSWGSILIFFLVIWLSVVISKIVRVILEEDVLDKFSLAKGVPRTISVVIRYSLITLGVFLAVSAAGMPLTSLTVIFGAFSIGIGFGLQNIFNNLVSGLILLFERPIQIGDTIEVGTLIGNVKSMGIRSSNVRTFDGAEIIVPNGHLISNEVVNWTLSDRVRRIEVIAGVAYGTDPHLVQQLFSDLLKKHTDILKDPEPNVFFQALGESSLDFRLLFWTTKFDEWIRIRSEIVFGIHDVLKENNIEIPFPQRDIHVRSIDQNLRIENEKTGKNL